MQANRPPFAQLELGPLSELGRHSFRYPGGIGSMSGKRFLKEALGLTGAEISVHKAGPGVGMPMLHRHRANEEIYLFLSGEGEFQADGQTFRVGEGSVVRVAPEAPRAWRNVGEGDLYYICIQAPAGGCAAVDVSDGERVDEPLVWPEAAG